MTPIVMTATKTDKSFFLKTIFNPPNVFNNVLFKFDSYATIKLPEPLPCKGTGAYPR
jgi:hypothetical protein